jgi:arylsulfatase A-like enzyme
MNKHQSAILFGILAISTSLPAAKLPNIVYIISDDQAWNDYGFMGHPDISTPHLDKLAKESVLYRRGYVPTALCRPSLMTMLTGRFAHQHGVTGNDPSPKYAKGELYNQRRAQLITYLDNFEALPKLLVSKGYLAHQSGKFWEGSYGHGGFTHGMTRGFPEKGGRHGDDGLKIGREGLDPVEKFVDHSIKEEKPFFLWYAPFLPHSPHTPPERILQKYTKDGRPAPVAKYYAMCEWFDETCGQLINILDKRNLRENTLIAYVCDNGWIQSPDSSRYAPRSKQTPNEGGIRTPIFFNWPGKLKPSDRPELISSIDIYPTLLASAGIQAPCDIPGINLFPNMENGTPLGRDTIFGESFAHDIADIEKPEASLLYRWCIQGEWKLLLTYDGEVNRYKSTHPRTEKRPQLFNLKQDPWENANLAAQNPELVSKLAQKIDGWYPLKERKALTTWE